MVPLKKLATLAITVVLASTTAFAQEITKSNWANHLPDYGKQLSLNLHRRAQC